MDFNMKYKIGDKIRMKEDCSGSGNLISKGKVLKVKSHKLFNNPESLFVGTEDYFCECQDKWQLIKKVKKTSKPKVCKHKYPNGISAQEIHQEEKTNYGDYNARYYTKVLVAVCKLCLEKKYI